MKSRAASMIGSLVFLFIAPGTVAGLIPWWITGWRTGPPFLGIAVSWAGLPFIVIGAIVILDSFLRFAWEGFGTPAPVAPPRTLIVSGLYRFVRNPMYVAALMLIVGQALFFASTPLFAYAAVIGIGFHLFVIVYEEPTLGRQFGDDYAAYRHNVRRWSPRLKPWKPTSV